MDDTVFITVHAAAATVAFGTGLAAIPSGRLVRVYRAAVVLAVAALVPAVLVDWATTDPVLRVVFLGLLGLGLVMVVRAGRAARNSPGSYGRPSAGYLDHVGFTLISLADGFAVVAVFRAGAPGWLVATVALGVAVTGHVLLQIAKRHLVRPPADASIRVPPRAASRPS